MVRRIRSNVAIALAALATVTAMLAAPAASRAGAEVPGDLAGAAGLNGHVVGIAPTADDDGYWLVGSDGGVFAYGDAGFYGSAGALHLNAPVVGIAATPDGRGYWMVASDGGVFAYGDAGFYGSAGALHLNAPVVGIAATPDGGGYWMVASDGGVFAYGDAGFYGSAGALHLNAPVVGIAATPDGGGYWMVASDGGLFTYGDAGFYGSAGALHLAAPVVALAVTPDGDGYWMAGADGGVFAYGEADFYGSALNGGQAVRVVGMAGTSDGEGCWLVSPDGQVLTYGDAGYFGSPATVIALYGDSLGMQAAPYFAYQAGASHASVLLRAYNGWALCDDLQAMANDAATRHPTVAVIEFSGNAMTQCMSGYAMGTTAYYDKYQADAQSAITIFRDAGIPVILVGSPVTAWANLNANVDFINAIYQSLAATNPGVTYVDAGQAVLDRGNFTTTLPCLSFEPCTGPAGANVVRSPDGVHFCPDGNATVEGPYDVCDVYSSGAFRFALAMVGPALGD